MRLFLLLEPSLLDTVGFSFKGGGLFVYVLCTA